MFLKEINISNFKAIDNKKIKFKEGLNLIIGDNEEFTLPLLSYKSDARMWPKIDRIKDIFREDYSRTEALMYKNEEEVLPISYLSAGYQSLIWMVL